MCNIAALFWMSSLGAEYRLESEVYFAEGEERAREAFLYHLSLLADRFAVHAEVVENADCGALGLSVKVPSRGVFAHLRFSDAYSEMIAETPVAACHFGFSTSPADNNWSSMINYGAMPVGIGLALFLWWARRTPRKREIFLGWQPRLAAHRAILPGVGAGVLTGLVAWGLASWAASAGFELPMHDSGDAAQFHFAILLTVVLVGPFLEEYGFRAFALDRAEGQIGMPAALLVTSVLFAAVHFPASITLAGIYLVLGLWLGLLWLRFRSLVLNVSAHATYNVVVILYVFLPQAA
ncbi:MAG TPA: CPBP family intramembrane metalloprotease [Xanthomonadaceae bacterium]|nr:CPBP family intramembrane metalloprotease [Xanthomonadaceae bacterium]